MASWYLSHIIVHDLQTRQRFYFLCNDWLAVEKSDGRIDRCLFVAGERQKTQIKFLIQKQSKEKLKDNHLWLSIFTRPIQSSFTRLDRVTCCFVLLYITMLMNIMYYGVVNSSNSSSGLKVGYFYVTTEQVRF
jgi:polycystin 1L2